ncbi:MAG: hypothetical protein JJU31_04820 [Wenzhouxiangella sp.]|nr:hypothetical protein [Wenzhouxiangella sp.]MCH8478113.1 hypothetical protein [Wenzhouxiangella sp.]TVR93878.1 MAG: hypothetical protein EA418_11295 [Wenzhouxiangellaceae bacterium]
MNHARTRFLQLPLSAVAAALLLAGCATTSTPPPQATDARSVDQRYVSTVERHALRTGAKVHWVNPPRTRDRRRGVDPFED